MKTLDINILSYTILMEIYKLQNPFKQVDLSTKVKLYPHQMNADYYVHLKRNLEKRIIGKCNNDGMFTEILKLTSYTENEIIAEEFNGDAEYDVKFIATICVPIKGTATILRVDNILSQYDDFIISATNGYIKCALPLSANKGVVHMDKGQIMFTAKNKPLLKGDYVKISISNERVEANANKMGIVGNLMDLATTEEIKLYYNSKYEIPQEEEKEEFDEIVFNDDDVVEGDKTVADI